MMVSSFKDHIALFKTIGDVCLDVILLTGCRQLLWEVVGVVTNMFVLQNIFLVHVHVAADSTRHVFYCYTESLEGTEHKIPRYNIPLIHHHFKWRRKKGFQDIITGLFIIFLVGEDHGGFFMSVVRKIIPSPVILVPVPNRQSSRLLHGN